LRQPPLQLWRLLQLGQHISAVEAKWEAQLNHRIPHQSQAPAPND